MARTALLAALLALAFPAAASAFDAHGSARQVYVTGLTPGAPTVLIKPGGKTVTRAADPQGGLLFRNLKPASGYQVRSGGAASPPLTVISDQRRAAGRRRLRPVDPLGRLRLPDHARRHQAGHQRASAAGRRGRAPGRRPAPAAAEAAGRRGRDPDADRVLRLRLRRPRRAAERDRGDRQPHGLHGRRRQHARHRLLGRRVRLLRAAAGPRRLRRRRDDRAPAVGRAPQGRDDGHLLRRHQPALHRAAAPAEPRRDLAAVGDRQHADDAVSRRHPQHRLRAQLGQGARPRRPAGLGERRPAVGEQADPGGRRDLQGQPGAARPGGRPAGEGPRQQPLRAEGGRPAGAGHVREQDQRADLHGLPVDRRADRRPLPDAGRALRRHLAQVVHVHQRHPRRLARPGDVQPLVRLPRALRRAGGAEHEGGDDPGGRAGRSTRRRWASTA